VKKQIWGITALVVIFAFGLMFTACDMDDSPVELLFSNSSRYAIYVTFTGGTPSKPSITLPGVTGANPAKTETVSCTKKTKYAWSVPGQSEEMRDRLVIAESNGAGLNFRDNPDGLFKVDIIPLD